MLLCSLLSKYQLLLQNVFQKTDYCPVHLPGQIIFCLGQNQICPIQNKFVKDKIFFVQDKNFVHGLKIIFAFGKLVSCHGQNFCLGQKIFCPGQNYFVEDKSDFVPDKNLFVRADGQGNSKTLNGLIRVKKCINFQNFCCSDIF